MMVSTELTLENRMEWAKALALSNMLPPQYRGHPENLLFAAEYADALGLARIAILTSIYVIDGKPAAQADVIQGLVRRGGHKLRVRVADDGQSVTATLIRADDPDFEFTSTWNLERAATAGLAGGANWRKYPVAMMSARAITEVARQGAAETLLGIRYTPEELGAVVADEDGTPIVAEPITAAVAIEAPPRVAEAHWAEDVATATTLDALREVWEHARHQGSLADVVGDTEQTVRSLLENRSRELGESPGNDERVRATEAQVATIGEWADQLEWNARATMAHIRKVIGTKVNDILDLTTEDAARVIASMSAKAEQVPGGEVVA